MAEIFNTTTLAIAIMGEDQVEANRKAATRTLRKFLRDELGEGKAVVGKGSRYALEYTKPQIKALTKKFNAWEVAQEEAKAARAEALAALRAPKADAPADAPIDAVEDDADEAQGIDAIDDSEIDFDAMLADAINGTDED